MGTATSPGIDPAIREFLAEKIPASALGRAGEFVGRFCFNGQVSVAAFLARATEERKLEQAFTVLEEFWGESWKFQRPETRGDPDGSVMNRQNLSMIYACLGMKPPPSKQPVVI
ncbi:hypothetical protein C4587_02725 [Candidatus Parcubacteria bacterium]|nr:MAG: hypothetical protein C4587_02725 [Candidatus Parcubacteria bacterium]